MDPFRPSQGYKQLDHTADLAIEFWAPTQEGLLVIGALALIEIMTGEEERADDARRTLEIEAVDPADRMIRFLNEVLVAATTDQFLLATARLELRDPGGLRATLRGQRASEGALVTELKSVTYHDLALEEHEYGWYGRVVVDV